MSAIGKWIPPEAMGKKFGWIRGRLRQVRNKVAHGLVDTADPSRGVVSVDDPEMFVLVQTWLPLLHALARLTIPKSGVREVPFGLPTPVAFEQLKDALAQNAGQNP